MPSSAAARWVLLLLAWSGCGARQLPDRPSAALSVRASRDTDRPAPCRSAVCRWEHFRAMTLPHEPRVWPARASLALAQLRLTTGPSSPRLAGFCDQHGLSCLHPLCPCGTPARRETLGGGTPDHDDMCDMLCGIGEGGSECDCIKPPGADRPDLTQ